MDYGTGQSEPCPQSNFRPTCAQALPALANLFEVARLRLGAAEEHPPQVIYVMLFGLGLAAAHYLLASVWPLPNRAVGFTVTALAATAYRA